MFDHEHQGVGALDARLGLPGTAVTLGRRDGEQDSAAHGLADQGLVPARDDLLGRRADDEAERRSRRPGGAEGLLGPPDVADVLRDHVLALDDLRAGALDQRLGHQPAGRRGGREGQRRRAAGLRADRGQVAAAVGLLAARRARGAGVGLEHVDDEHQRGGPLDAELAVARGAVALRGRDDGEDAAAHLLADQRGLQARQHRAADHRRVAGEGVGLQRGTRAIPEVKDEVRGQGVGLGQRGAGALNDRLDRESGARLGLRDRHVRRLAERSRRRDGRIRGRGGRRGRGRGRGRFR